MSKAIVVSTALAFVLCAAASPSAAKEVGLQLSVQKETVTAGSPVTVRWEIVPDGVSTVSIILGVIRPDGEIECYRGPGKGFVPLDTIDSAPRVVTGFPFNTELSAVLDIRMPAAWQKGTYQFVAAVMDGKEIVEVDYSNTFSVE
jgi:hypothetical protein